MVRIGRVGESEATSQRAPIATFALYPIKHLFVNATGSTDINGRSARPRPRPDLRPGRGRGALPDGGRQPHAGSDGGPAGTPLALDPDDHLALPPEPEPGGLEGAEVVARGDGAADAARGADGPELVDVAVVLVPDLVRAAVGPEVPVAGAVGVVGWVVHAEGFHHVVLALSRRKRGEKHLVSTNVLLGLLDESLVPRGEREKRRTVGPYVQP